MNNHIYKWEGLGTFRSEIESLEFISLFKGWMSDFIFNKQKGKIKRFRKYRQSINRIQITEDGGNTWKIIHQSESSGLMRYFQYINSIGWLLSIKVLYHEKQHPPLKFILYKSLDEGHKWEKVCDLPYSTKGFYFFDEYNGYAWTLGKIFATSNQGKFWRLIASKDIIYKKGKSNNIGRDQIVYFIKENNVKGLNPWKNIDIILPLPQDFKPENILTSPVVPTIYVLGISKQGYMLLAYEKDRLISEELVPIKKWQQFKSESFTYGDDILNLVGSVQGSFFKSYYFYIRDERGWHEESLSGCKNFEHFAYWGNNAWAVRISLLKGKRELLWRNK